MTIVINLGSIVHFLFWGAVAFGLFFLVGFVLYWVVEFVVMLAAKVSELTKAYPEAFLGALVIVISYVMAFSLMP
jgi:hypothetical protein